MEDFSEDTIMEEREELMVSLIDKKLKPILRIAHFLKPTISSTEKVPSPPLNTNIQEQTSSSLKIKFKGGISYLSGWSKWVDQLKPLYQEVWKKAGIYEAILASTFKIKRHNDLIIALGERWCLDTNTFVFAWGEATITLEDIVVLGGYSVLGHCVLDPIKAKDYVDIEMTLQKAPRVLHSWMRFYEGKGGHLEHVAFLTLWLSRFVLPATNYQCVDKALFPVAIHLSLGNLIALAPAVLASIYRDLRLLKRFIMSSDKCKEVPIFRAPLQFVQLWAWERFFPCWQLKPNVMSRGEPRISRWHMVKIQRCLDPRRVIDSEKEWFLWRPYATKVVKDWDVNKFYKENDEYVVVGPNVGIENLIFTRIIRACELVGMDCVEKYHPHRVSMQFGFDQDVPGCVNNHAIDTQIAWSNYARPINDAKLYIPSRFFESDVSKRYLEWWKNQKIVPGDAVKQSKIYERIIPRMSWGDCGKINASISGGFVPQCDEVSTDGNIKDCEMEVVESSDDDDSLTIAETSHRRRLMQKGIPVPGNQEPLPSTQSQSSSALNDGTARQRETLMESNTISEKHETSNRKSTKEGDEPYEVKERMPQESMDNNDRGGCKLNLHDSLELASDGPNVSRSDCGGAEFLTIPAKMSLQMSKASVEAPKVTAKSTNITEGKMQMENTNNHEKVSGRYKKIDTLKLEMRIRNLENFMAGKVPRLDTTRKQEML